MSPSAPRLSIGVPAYNGERFLAQALDSILEQTFTDYEVIICDNASTDGTRAIAEDYAARDARIRYVRNERNIGAAPNFNRTFQLARATDYFKWAAHDDVMAPTFLERCVAVLDDDPDAVVASSRSTVIDPDGNVIEPYEVEQRLDDPSPKVRLHDLLWIEHRVYEVFGVMRKDILAKTRLIEGYSASDRTLMVGMSQFGKIVVLPEHLFFPRKHEMVSVRSHTSRHSRMVWFDPRTAGKVVMPTWALLIGYVRAITRAPLSLDERLYGYRQMLRWMWAKRGKLWGDVSIAARQIVLRVVRPGRLREAQRRHAQDTHQTD